MSPGRPTKEGSVEPRADESVSEPDESTYANPGSYWAPHRRRTAAERQPETLGLDSPSRTLPPVRGSGSESYWSNLRTSKAATVVATAVATWTPRRWPYRVMMAVGLVLILGVAAWQVEITLWTNHSNRVGRQLVNQFLKNRSLADPVALAPGTAALAACGGALDPSAAQGVISIPKLGVEAPVLQGTDDPQLNVGVGHDANSVWPGNAGNAVLEAHDVSYFQNLPNLSPGDVVIYEAPCTTYTYTVQSHAVVKSGTPVYNTPTATMTLVTCWPTDALWYTPDRFLVTAQEVSATPASGATPTFSTSSPAPTVPVPTDLAQQGVTLATFSMPMGTMSLAGSPDTTWSQTTNPLLVENSAVEAFIAGLRSLEQNRLDWWGAVAPGVPPPGPLQGASVSFLSPLEVTVDATGMTATGAQLTDTVRVTGGKAPGTYSMSVTETIAKGVLTITGWSVGPT